jgi:hypothetical protein
LITLSARASTFDGREPDLLCRSEINYQLELSGLLKGKFGGIAAFDDLST